MRVATLAGERACLTFCLSGLSKLVGLPQLKLGWIVANGPDAARKEALERLEHIADTYLSVAAPVQHAAPSLLALVDDVGAQIAARVRENRASLARALAGTRGAALRRRGRLVRDRAPAVDAHRRRADARAPRRRRARASRLLLRSAADVGGRQLIGRAGHAGGRTCRYTAPMHALTLLAVVIKIATLAPEGSAWMNLFHKWQARVEQRSEGRLKIKFYAGGVMGDERDVIRKMHAGQLSGAAITGIGLAMINPEVRALEASRTYAELDHARERLDPLLRKKFDEKGYLLMGWGDVGPVHIFSQRPIKSLDDLRQTKLWHVRRRSVDQADVRCARAARRADGRARGAAVAGDGRIDAFFGSPLSTVALQWSAHARYVTSAVIGMATGATVMTKKAWGEIEPRDQQIIVEEAKTMEAEVTKQVREDNTKAFDSCRRKTGCR